MGGVLLQCLGEGGRQGGETSAAITVFKGRGRVTHTLPLGWISGLRGGAGGAVRGGGLRRKKAGAQETTGGSRREGIDLRIRRDKKKSISPSLHSIIIIMLVLFLDSTLSLPHPLSLPSLSSQCTSCRGADSPSAVAARGASSGRIACGRAGPRSLLKGRGEWGEQY